LSVGGESGDAHAFAPRLVAACAALALLAVAPYLQTARFGFVNYDDTVYVTENARVLGGLTLDNARWAFTTGYNANWHPVTWLSHMLDMSLFGVRPGAFHLVNAGLHAACTVLLFLAFHRMTGRYWRCVALAALFAAHPLRVESVAWISERKDLLCGVFWMAGLLAYAGYARRPGAWRYLAMAAWFALALMSKPMAVTFPCALLLLDLWPLRRADLNDTRGWARLAIEKVPLFAMALAASAVTAMVQRSGGAMSGLDAIPLTWRLENAATASVLYVWKALVPVNLAVFYPHPYGTQPWWMPAGAALLLAAISAVCLLQMRARPWLAVGWFWHLGLLVPVIGIVQVGTQAMADRYSYLPSVGLAILLVWGLAGFLGSDRRGRAFLAVAGFLCVAVLLGMSTVQASRWRDTVTLFGHAARVTRDNETAWYKLGSEHALAGRVPEAEAAFRNAVSARPDSLRSLRAHGQALGAMGQLGEAAEVLGRAVAAHPDDSSAWNDLGVALTNLGRAEDALDAFGRALALDADNAEARDNRGAALLALGRADEAHAYFTKTVRERPHDPVLRNNLALALHLLGRDAEAREHLAEALRLDPAYTPALALAELLDNEHAAE
jgi:protein O-mannosyl-transferase